MTAKQKAAGGETSFIFTGWHMLATMVAFFGVIISVNIYMAYNAVTSWSGLVAPNTYVASQEFNGKAAEARALAATGVKGRITIAGSDIRYELFHPEKGAVAADLLVLTFKRPVGERQDFTLELQPAATGVFTASHAVAPGHWIVDADASLTGRRILRQAERIAVRGNTP